ncbi:MAG: hypothetical protein Tsb0021_02870 [Chlamydiales bacterium]
MDTKAVVVFGESEKGGYHKPYLCHSLPQLVDTLGHPPPDSRGLFFAVQTILYDYPTLFFRVREEGFSYNDYFKGVELLRKHGGEMNLGALFAPGVGSSEVIEALSGTCELCEGILITTESDLYDFLTDSSFY